MSEKEILSRLQRIEEALQLIAEAHAAQHKINELLFELLNQKD